jgi:hypothetical protein
VPAGDRSWVGMGAMALPPVEEVDVDVFVPDVDEVEFAFDGEELQAARPKAPAAPMRAARDHGRRKVRAIGRDGSRSV